MRCCSITASDELLRTASDSGRNRSPVACIPDELRGTAALQCAVAVFEGRHAAKIEGATMPAGHEAVTVYASRMMAATLSR